MVQVGAAAIAYHETFCGKGQLISEAVDLLRKAHPILTDLTIIITALHLLRRLPPKVDPYKWLDRIAQPLKGNTE